MKIPVSSEIRRRHGARVCDPQHSPSFETLTVIQTCIVLRELLRVTDPRSVAIPGRTRRHQDGSATLIFTILLGIMLILVTAEMRSLAQLHQEERLLERQQLKRLDQSQSPTNTVTPAVTLTASK